MAAIKGFEQISLSGSTIFTLTVPAGASKAVMQADTQNVRMRLDGTDPTASVGEVLVALASPRELFGSELTAAKFIATTGSPKLNVHYYGSDAP
jgi:hypothetical protein